MRIVFALLAILALGFGVIGLYLSRHDPHYFWLGRLGGGAFTISGLLLITGAVKNYRGHWSFVVGLLLLSAALFGAGSELDDKVAEKSRRARGALIACLSTLGFLSLLSAQKLHRLSGAPEGRDGYA